MATGKNIDDARETYSGFTNLVKWGAICSAVAAAFVVFLIS